MKQAISDELGRLSACKSDTECGKHVSIAWSCGCSPVSVVRLDADDTKYNALLAQLDTLHDVPGCESRSGTCVCPDYDGPICDGHCRWKPLDRSVLCDRLVQSYVGTRKRECEPGGAMTCTAKLTLKNGTIELVREGMTSRGFYQCKDGELQTGGGLTYGALTMHADRSLAWFDDVFVPIEGAPNEEPPAPAVDERGRSEFMPPSGDINCVYTARDWDGVYVPHDGGPELSCDRSGPHAYERVFLGPRGPAQIVKRVGDASCCGVEPILPEGARLTRGPFQCEVKGTEVLCKRDDGYGFAIGGKRARVFRE